MDPRDYDALHIQDIHCILRNTNGLAMLVPAAYWPVLYHYRKLIRMITIPSNCSCGGMLAWPDTLLIVDRKIDGGVKSLLRACRYACTVYDRNLGRRMRGMAWEEMSLFRNISSILTSSGGE